LYFGILVLTAKIAAYGKFKKRTLPIAELEQQLSGGQRGKIGEF
jgi:hypothetical protein